MNKGQDRLYVVTRTAIVASRLEAGQLGDSPLISAYSWIPMSRFGYLDVSSPFFYYCYARGLLYYI